MSRSVDASRYAQIQQFLYREARLLDNRDYDGWIGLLSPDIHYWAPNRSNRVVTGRAGDRDIALELSAVDEPSIYDENFETLKLRISRVTTASKLWCENPPSRVRHVITNIEAYHHENSDDAFEVYSNFAVYQSRFDEKGVAYFGGRKDVLHENADGRIEIFRRMITLDVTLVPTGAITVFF